MFVYYVELNSSSIQFWSVPSSLSLPYPIGMDVSLFLVYTHSLPFLLFSSIIVLNINVQAKQPQKIL